MSDRRTELRDRFMEVLLESDQARDLFYGYMVAPGEDTYENCKKVREETAKRLAYAAGLAADAVLATEEKVKAADPVQQAILSLINHYEACPFRDVGRKTLVQRLQDALKGVSLQHASPASSVPPRV